MQRDEKDTPELIEVHHPAAIDIDVTSITVEEAASRILDHIGTVR